MDLYNEEERTLINEYKRYNCYETTLKPTTVNRKAMRDKLNRNRHNRLFDGGIIRANGVHDSYYESMFISFKKYEYDERFYASLEWFPYPENLIIEHMVEYYNSMCWKLERSYCIITYNMNTYNDRHFIELAHWIVTSLRNKKDFKLMKNDMIGNYSRWGRDCDCYISVIVSNYGSWCREFNRWEQVYTFEKKGMKIPDPRISGFFDEAFFDQRYSAYLCVMLKEAEELKKKIDKKLFEGVKEWIPYMRPDNMPIIHALILEESYTKRRENIIDELILKLNKTN